MRFFNTFILALLLFVTSCDKSNDGAGSASPEKMVDVVIGVAPAATTRTAIGDDDGKNATVKWCVGDQVAVWADGVTDGATPLEGSMFELNYYGTDYSTAEFSSTISEMDDEQKYNYCAFYPCPNEDNKISISGKEVRYTIPSTQSGVYTIPSTQSGVYDRTLDFRVAESVQGVALSGSIIGNPELTFKSLTHALKISIPADREVGDITKIYVITSTGVVGDVVLDMDNISYEPSVVGDVYSTKFTFNDKTTLESDNCNFITLDLSKNPISNGEGSAWLFINPTTKMESISLVAFSGETKVGSHTIKLEDDRVFEAGYITPVNFGADMEDAIPTSTLNLKMGANNLGEKVNNVKISTPKGLTFADGTTTTAAIKPEGTEGNISVEFDAVTYVCNLEGKVLSATFDSPSATVSGEIELVEDNFVADYLYKYDVPYLFFEDFSGLKDYSNHDDYDKMISSDAKHHAASLASAGLTGWSGDRIGIDADAGSIRVTCRLEGGGIEIKIPFVGTIEGQSNYRYTGRLDSAPINTLKSNKVNISVQYNYSGGYKQLAGDESPTMYYRHSYTTNQSVITAPTYEKWGWPLSKFRTTDKIIYENKLADGGSYTSITKDGKYTIKDFVKGTRLSWLIDVDRGFEFDQNGHYWLYIDNVRVSITK